MDAAAELGRNPVRKHQISLSMEMSRLTRDGTAGPVSRDQILRHARGQGNINFPFSADHEQDWQPYPVDPYSTIYIHTYIHTYILRCPRTLFKQVLRNIYGTYNKQYAGTPAVVIELRIDLYFGTAVALRGSIFVYRYASTRMYVV